MLLQHEDMRKLDQLTAAYTKCPEDDGGGGGGGGVEGDKQETRGNILPAEQIGVVETINQRTVPGLTVN